MAVPPVLRAIRRVRSAGAARLAMAGAVALGVGAFAGGVFGSPSAGAASTTAEALSTTTTATPTDVASNITFFRQAGPDRYATAAAIAADTFGTSAPTVILTTGASFPDALAAAYLAGTETGGAPILLTAPSALSPETSTALTELHTTHVIIVGGTGAVSTAVQTALAASYQVSRIAGTTRYDTAEMVDTTAGAPVGKDSAGQPTAILASGTGFADALSAAPLSYARHTPIVLTAPGSLSPQAKAVLTDDHITHVVQVGGTGALATAVTQAVKSMGISVDEVAGADRSATSALLAADELDNYGFSDVHLDLASGTDFADALAGGPNAGAAGSPVLLTASSSDPGSAPGWVAGHCSTLSSGDIFGGTGALGASTAQLVGLACPSNASVQLSVAAVPTPVATAGSATAALTTTLTASVSVCGPPGSEVACTIGSGQKVVFGTFPSRAGVCGILDPTAATANSSGTVTAEYTPGTVSGTCIVTATANHYSSSVALSPTSGVSPPPPCTTCCGPVPVASGTSSANLSCCYSPPCTTQVCPDGSPAPATSSVVEPAIIVCPLEPAAAPAAIRART